MTRSRHPLRPLPSLAGSRFQAETPLHPGARLPLVPPVRWSLLALPGLLIGGLLLVAS